ncbi:MAG TPA: hypothetical protein VKK31_28050 [Thermoanaerobaculia bacterium]|nr:hypothetical protein [Thermoanaerobaculia bacterium]
MDDKLDQAIAAIEADERKVGANLLLALLQVEPDNEDAWLWLETVSDSPEKRKLCLTEVLRINPRNREARRGLASLQELVQPVPQISQLSVDLQATPDFESPQNKESPGILATDDVTVAPTIDNLTVTPAGAYSQEISGEVCGNLSEHVSIDSYLVTHDSALKSPDDPSSGIDLGISRESKISPTLQNSDVEWQSRAQELVPEANLSQVKGAKQLSALEPEALIEREIYLGTENDVMQNPPLSEGTQIDVGLPQFKFRKSARRWDQPFKSEEDAARAFLEYVDELLLMTESGNIDPVDPGLSRAISSLRFAKKKHEEAVSQNLGSVVFLSPSVQSATTIAEVFQSARRYQDAFWTANIFCELAKILVARNRQKYQEYYNRLLLVVFSSAMQVLLLDSDLSRIEGGEISWLRSKLDNIGRYVFGTYFNSKTGNFAREWQPDNSLSERLTNEALARHFDQRLRQLVHDDRPRVREYVTSNLPLIYRFKLDDTWESKIDEWERLLVGTGYDDLIHYLRSTGVLIRADKVGQLNPERLDDVRRAAANNDLNRVRDLLKDSANDLKAYLYAEAQARLDYRQPPHPRLADKIATDLFGRAKRLAERSDEPERLKDALALIQDLWEKDIGNLELRDWVAYLHAKNDNPKAAEPILEQIRRRREAKQNFSTIWNLAVLAYDRKDEAAAYELLVPLLDSANPDEGLVLVIMALSLKLDDRERFLSIIPRTLSLRFHPLGIVVAHDLGDRVREGELTTQLLRQSQKWELPAVSERFTRTESFNQIVNKAIVEGQVDLLISWLDARVKLQRGWIPNYLALARVLEDEKQDVDGAFRILLERIKQSKNRQRDQQKLDEGCRDLFDLCRRSSRKDLGQQAYGVALSFNASIDLLNSFSSYAPVQSEPLDGRVEVDEGSDRISMDTSKMDLKITSLSSRDPRLAERLAWVTARLASIRNIATYVQDAQAVGEFCKIIIEMSPQEGGTVVKLIQDISEVIDIFDRIDNDDHDTRRVLYDRSVGYDERLTGLSMSGALPRSLADVLTPYHVALKKVVGDLSRQAGIGPNVEVVVLNSFFSVEAGRSTLILRLTNVSDRPASDVVVELLLDNPALAVVGRREKSIPALDPKRSALLSFALEKSSNIVTTDARELRFGVSLRASAEGFPNVDLGIVRRAIPIGTVREAIGLEEVPKLFQAATPLRPARPELFQGRSDIIAKVSGSFYGGIQRERFFLDGIRRVGKTSILNFLPLSLPETVFPVSVNLDKFGLKGPMSSANILRQFCVLISDSGRSEGDIEINVPDLSLFDNSPAETFNKFLLDLKSVSSGRVPFVMVDEFQELLQAVARTGRSRERDTLVLDQIRGHSDEGNIYMIFTGSVRFDRLSSIVDHRIFGSLTRLRVSFLSEGSVGDVLRAGLEEWVSVPPETVRRVYELTGGYPWLVQTYGAGLVDIVNRERRAVVTPEDVSYVTREAVLCNDELFRHWWPSDQLGLEEERFVEWLFRNYSGGEAVPTRDIFSSVHSRELPSFRRAFENLRACEVLDSTQTELLRFSGAALRQWLEQKMQDGQLKVRVITRPEVDRGQVGMFVDHENLIKSLERISRARGVDVKSDRVGWFSRIINNLVAEAERRFGPLKFKVAVAFWERPQEAALVPVYFKFGFQPAAPEPVKLANAVDFKVASEVRRANEQALREGTRLSRAIVVTGDGDLSHEARALVNDGVLVQIWGGSRETSESYRDIVGDDNIVVLDDVSGI